MTSDDDERPKRADTVHKTKGRDQRGTINDIDDGPMTATISCRSTGSKSLCVTSSQLWGTWP